MDTFDPTNLPDTADIPASIVASGLSDAPLTTAARPPYSMR